MTVIVNNNVTMLKESKTPRFTQLTQVEALEMAFDLVDSEIYEGLSVFDVYVGKSAAVGSTVMITVSPVEGGSGFVIIN